MSRSEAVILMLLLLAAGGAAAAEDEIVQAEKAWASAVMRRDAAALDRILDEALIYAHSTGVVETKAQYVGRLMSGAQRYDLIEHLKLTVKMHGNAAVAHAQVLMKGEADKRPFDNRLMMLHLWVKRGGQWRLAAHQTTELK